MIAVLVLLVIGLVSGNIFCPDGTECQDKTTCCPTKTGYACCQYPSAVCCPDKAHCCPQDYQCDLETQLCKKKGFSWYKIPRSSQIPAREKEKRAPAPLVKSVNPPVPLVQCDTCRCPDGTTCCNTPHGQWSCCPHTLGQCCFDGIHCCPSGYHCDSTSTHCSRGALTFPAFPQIAAMQSNNIQGQCCRDGLHCCPYGFRCDFTSTRCYIRGLSLSASPQIAAMERNTIQDQCCQSETGCCAVGFHCDEKSRTCVRDFEYLSPPKSILNLQNQAGIIHCSDQFYCPAGNSCCKSQTGQLACCPYPLGQCCKDGKHCCEYGYDCDSTFTKCKKGYSSVPALLTQEALLR